LMPGVHDDQYPELLRSGGTIWDEAKTMFKNWRDSVVPVP